VTFSRSKGSTVHENLMFLHMKEWLLCPMHSLACLLIMRNFSSSDLLFPTIHGKEASYVNSLFRQIYNIWVENPASSATGDHELTSALTSHSCRRGSASDAHGHSDIQLEMLNDRGGWKMVTLMNIFGYLSSNRKNDGKVGRIISGWTHAHVGGIAPSIEAIPKNEQRVFESYSVDLMGGLASSMRLTLVLILLLRYEDLKASYPQHVILMKMEGKRRVSPETLQRWSVLVKKDFIQRNATSLSTLPEDQLIPLGDLQSHISTQALALQNKTNSTRASHVVTHRTTDQAR
jgi:hypothetical protein